MSAEPEELDLGRRQAARQRILIPPSGGSNPPAPARQSGLGSDISQCVRTRDFPAGYAGGSQSLAGNSRYFGPCGVVSGTGLCSPFSNFRLAVAETGSIADRDRFAECPSGIRRTPARVHGIGRHFDRAMRILSRKAVFLVACLLQAISPPRPMTPALIAGATMRVQPSPPARPTNRAGPWRLRRAKHRGFRASLPVLRRAHAQCPSRPRSLARSIRAGSWSSGGVGEPGLGDWGLRFAPKPHTWE